MIIDPVFKVSESGISAPSYSEILEYFQSKAREIFGQDVDLDADTQDGQLIAIFASAISDVNAQAIATYNQFSPATAVGVGLDRAVKTNGIHRKVATNSQVDLRIVGQAGTIIKNGVAIDKNDNRWLMPDVVVIPIDGEITVRATAKEAGSISAEPNTVVKIGNPTLGWQSVNNLTSATVGFPVETDAQLRQQQLRSTALPSISLWEGIVGSLLNLDGVTRVSGIRNDEDTVTPEGVPGHSIAMIVDGGDVEKIGETIFKRKGEGTGTYGDVKTTYVDTYGFPNFVRFSRPVIVDIAVTLKIRPLPTYLSDVANEIKIRITEYINSLKIGDSVNISNVLASAIKECSMGVDTRFEVEGILMGKHGNEQTVASIPVQWNEAAHCDQNNVTVEVLSL